MTIKICEDNNFIVNFLLLPETPALIQLPVNQFGMQIKQLIPVWKEVLLRDFIDTNLRIISLMHQVSLKSYSHI